MRTYRQSTTSWMAFLDTGYEIRLQRQFYKKPNYQMVLVFIGHQGIYAQAYYLYREGYKYWFDDNEVTDRRNSRFMVANPEEKS